MRFTSISELQEKLIHCACTHCPYRSEAPGFYPKPPRGPHDAKVMIVFENPGPPSGMTTTRGGTQDPQMGFTIKDIKLGDALRWAIKFQDAWLFETSKLNRKAWDTADFVIGTTVYTTDSHKCPDPRDPEKDPADPDKKKKNNEKNKRRARKYCLAYLREEIRLIQPKVIIAFGNYARRSLKSIERVKWKGSLKFMADNDRVKIVGRRLFAMLPHPNSIWRKPPMSKKAYEAAIEYVFGKATEFLEATA
jgi:uracil-DNA glycosylase